MHNQFSALDGLEQHVIETAGQSRAETLEAVHAALANEAFCLQKADQ
ncbi:TPA: hypothetical protein L3M79_003824 [Clostridioides difficile]|nr:hypothetical protein [Clostridioides difficile]